MSSINVSHSPRSFCSRGNSDPLLIDGLSCDHSATMVSRLDTRLIVIRKVNLPESFRSSVSRMKRMVLRKAYVEEDIEDAVCSHDAYVSNPETSPTVFCRQSVVWLRVPEGKTTLWFRAHHQFCIKRCFGLRH